MRSMRWQTLLRLQNMRAALMKVGDFLRKLCGLPQWTLSALDGW